MWPDRVRTTGSASWPPSSRRRSRGAPSSSPANASPDIRNYRVDASKIATALPAFQPRWTARDGARQLYEAFRENPITVDDFEGWRFRRIGQINKLLEAGALTGDLHWK